MGGLTVAEHTTLRRAVDGLPRASILHLGDHGGALVAALADEAEHVVTCAGSDVLAAQLDRRFDLVVAGIDPLVEIDGGRRRAVMHIAMQHLERAGHLVVIHRDSHTSLCDEFWAGDLLLVGSYPMPDANASLFRRGERTTVHDLLFEARATIGRVSPGQLAQRVHDADGTLILDTRTHTDRERFGVIPGAVHVPRTVVEWHCDPANGYLHPRVTSFDQPLVLVCNSGYSSSLAAANLVRVGFTDVADLIGGHTAWAAAGLPVNAPDHSHLDMPGFDDPAVSSGR
ncbi:MAG: rhodanese-like domain-containing protein [Actinomycetota bacterium]|nr:rhodanese-like domain-containing protein [Actinomycetota bacterium]